MRTTPSLALLCAALTLACGGGSTQPPADASDPGSGPDAGTPCQSVEDCKDVPTGPCERVACSAEAGVCVVLPDAALEGTACDPDDQCALAPKTCRSGVCEYGKQVECSDRACMDSQGCDPVTGTCGYKVAADGAACDSDRNPCTKDECAAGVCEAGANECGCQGDGDCPTNPDKCVPLSCDPGTKKCVAGTPVDCGAAADPCRPIACIPATGECATTTLDDGTQCDPGDPCEKDGGCKAGQCTGTAKCDDGNDCTSDACDAATGACSHDVLTGDACDDGNECTSNDRCQKGLCLGDGPDCDDDDPCTTDGCDLEDGCVHVTIDAGEPCDDGDPCTEGDQCDAAHACTGSARICDDSNDCTADSCDAAVGGCRFDPVDGACDDGDPCTAGEQCAAGTCGGGADVFGCCVADDACDDGDACTVESCDPGLHACRYDGETTAVCGASGACEGAFCRGETGACETFGRGMPRVLFAWDLRGTLPPAGFRWTAAGGTLGATGAVAAAASGPDGTAFRLPGRRLPGGVIVLHADLGPDTACDDVAIRVTGADITADHRGCGTDATGRRVLAASWNVADGAIADVEVRMKTGNVVAGVTVFAWAGVDCRPLDPVVVAEGTGIKAFSLAGDRTLALGGFVNNKTPSAMRADLAGIAGATPLDGAASCNGDTRVASLALPDGRFLLAFGADDQDRIVLALVGRDGATIDRTLLDMFSPSDEQREPALFTGPDGAARLVWTSKLDDITGHDIRMVRVDITGDQIGPFGVPERVNVTTDGSQHSPAVWYGQDSGMIAFVTDGPPIEVRVRKIDAVGAFQGAESILGDLTSDVDRLSVAGAGDNLFVAWDDGLGSILGRVINQNLTDSVSFALNSPNQIWSRPSIHSVSGSAQLISLRQDQTSTEFVQTTIDPVGKLSPFSTISEPVVTPSTVSTAHQGPFSAWFSYFNTALVPHALRIGLASPFCGSGPVVCANPAAPAVCVGFGATGYEAVAGATWCP